VTDGIPSSVDVSTLMGNPVAIELTMALGTITDVTDGLRGLVPLVATAAEQHDEKSANAVAEQSPAAARIFDERKKSLRDALDAAVDKMHARLETLPVDRDAVERVTSAKFLTDPVGTVEAIAPDAMGIIGDLMGEFSNLPLTSLDEADYLRAYATAPMRASRRSLLLRSLYLTGLGSIEPLLARMVRLLLVHAEGHRYPSLTAPGLEERVRELCYGPPSKWRTSLVSDLGVEQLAEAADWTDLDRMWEDRNAFMHRAGIVDERHAATSGLDVGMPIELTSELVEQALDRIGVLRFVIVACVHLYLHPGVRDALYDEAFARFAGALRDERWSFAEGVVRLLDALADDERTRAEVLVDRWLIKSRKHGAAAVKAEVQAWDVSELGPRFAMARLFLLEEWEAALAMLDELVRAAAVKRVVLISVPLFDPVRQMDRFRRILEMAP
jgi:hypothetical protein